MKTTIILISFSAFALTLHAQPTLTSATNAPQVGTQYTLNHGNHVSPGSAGASQTWNLTGLESDSTDLVQLVDPSNTPNGTQFPGATVAEVSNPVTSYYQATTNGIYFAGSFDGVSSIVNAPLPKSLPFPCTMGTTWSTPYAAEFDYEGEPVFRTGTVSGQADGYGTLNMPWGTVTNVLRIHLTHTLQDSLSLFNIDYTYDSYLYYAPGQSHPIAELVSSTIDFGFGVPDVVEFSRWTGELNTMVQEGHDHALLHLFPNPANEQVNLVLPSSLRGPVQVDILDASGHVAKQPGVGSNAAGVLTLDVTELVAGIYHVRATAPSGVTYKTTFIKQ